MPIPEDKINHNWLEWSRDTTVREAKERLARDDRRKQWIVTPISQNEYAVWRVADLIDYLLNELYVHDVTERMLDATLEEIRGFLPRFTRAAVDANADWQDVQETWSALADPPLVVLRNGTPIGILRVGSRLGGGDIDFIDRAPMPEPKSANGGGERAEPPPPQPGTLGGPEPAPSTAPTRFINAVLQDHDKNAPLQVGETYTLAFSVELEKLAAAVSAEKFKEQNLFPEGVMQVELMVQLLSDDFLVHSDPQKLIVPRTGKSKNKARFDIEPTQNGAGELTAVFIKDGNAVQAIKLTLNVGMAGSPSVLGSENIGRQLETAGVLQPRDLLLWIEYTGTNYTLRVLDKVPMKATLPLSSTDLENAVVQARQTLESVVNLDFNNEKIFQVETKIPSAARDMAMPLLAKAGYLLYQELFYHALADTDTRKLGDYLRQRAQNETLKIQIVSADMMLPWGLLYMEDDLDINHVNPESFLGFKHLIEHVPFQSATGYSETINSQPQLTISLNLNTDIDTQMNFPLVQKQLDYWKNKKLPPGVQLVKRTSGNDLLAALGDATTSDQIMYFYCHAVSKEAAQGGANLSELHFANGQKLSLGDFKAFAPTKTRLGTLPLVFINACESAQLSPLFYNGFMPYFVDKGARGMIGSECSVPALFAMEWSFKFFDQLLAGKSIGQIFLDLRRDYYSQNNNPLGLLYAVYCDADTQIAPAVA